MLRLSLLLGCLSVLLPSLSYAADPVFDANVSPAIRQQMMGDVNFMAALQAARVSPLHQKVYGQLKNQAYKNFFYARIKSVGLNNCGGGAAFACVIPNQSTTKMNLTPNFVKLSMPQVARVSILLHESRHTERQNNFWNHVNCPTPFLDANGRDIVGIVSGRPLAGAPACDVTALGAYGIQLLMLKNIQENCSNCTEKVKQDGQLFGDDTLKRIINQKELAALKMDLGVR